MNDQNRDPMEQVGSALTGIGYQLRKGLDRVSFEADRRMRVSRVKVEVGRLQKQAANLMDAISERVLELEADGAEMEPSIKGLVGEVRALRRQLADKATEVEAINSEQWVEPPPPVAPAISAPDQPRSLPAGKPEVIEGLSRPVQEKAEKPRKSEQPTTCPNCNGPLRPMSVFCPNCGYKL